MRDGSKKEEKAFGIMEKHMFSLGDWLGRCLDPKNPKDDLGGPKCRKAILEEGYMGKKDGRYAWRLRKGCQMKDFSITMEVIFKVGL